jgi:hypothetical protein
MPLSQKSNSIMSVEESAFQQDSHRGTQPLFLTQTLSPVPVTATQFKNMLGYRSELSLLRFSPKLATAYCGWWTAQCSLSVWPLLRVMRRWPVQALALLNNGSSIVSQSGLIVQCSKHGDGKVGRDGAVGAISSVLRRSRCIWLNL